MSSGANRYSVVGCCPVRSCSTSAVMATEAMSPTGWRSEVSGGSMNALTGESSKPMTDTSRGIDSPMARAARMTPSAMGSEAQTMPVAPASMSRRPVACPPSMVNSECSTRAVKGSSVVRRGRHEPLDRLDLAHDRRVALGPDGQADPAVPERDEVLHGHLDRGWRRRWR